MGKISKLMTDQNASDETSTYTDETAAQEGPTTDDTYTANTVTSFSTPTHDEVVAELTAPLDRSRISKREGAFGKMLDYLEWNDVAHTLNRIFGFGNWSTDVVSIEDLGTPDENGVPPAVRAIVRLSVTFPPTHDAYASATAMYTSVGEAKVRQAWDKVNKRPKPRTWESHAMASQSAERNGFKRCAAFLGEQFGLGLYGDGDDKDEERESYGEETTTTTTRSSSSSNSNGARAELSYETEEAECEECGKAIKGYTSKGGKTYTTADLVKYSKRDCDGHIFCYDHKNDYLLAHGKRG